MSSRSRRSSARSTAASTEAPRPTRCSCCCTRSPRSTTRTATSPSTGSAARSGRAPRTARTSSASSPRSRRAAPYRHRRARLARLVRPRDHGHRDRRPAVDKAVNAVSPYARAKLNVRIHPEQDAGEAQQAVIRHLESVKPFGIDLKVSAGALGNGFFGDTSGPAHRAAAQAMSRSGASSPPTPRRAAGSHSSTRSTERRPTPRSSYSVPWTATPTSTARTSAFSSRSSRRPSQSRPSLRPVRGQRRMNGAPVPAPGQTGRGFMERLLDGIERAGNKMPTRRSSSAASASS